MAVIVLKHKIQALWFIMIRALLPFPEKLHNLVLLCSEHLSGVPSDCKAFFIFIFLTPQDKLGGKLCLTFQGNSGVSGIILGHCAYKSDYEVSPCKVFSFLHACSSVSTCSSWPPHHYGDHPLKHQGMTSISTSPYEA